MQKIIYAFIFLPLLFLSNDCYGSGRRSKTPISDTIEDVGSELLGIAVTPLAVVEEAVSGPFEDGGLEELASYLEDIGPLPAKKKKKKKILSEEEKAERKEIRRKEAEERKQKAEIERKEAEKRKAERNKGATALHHLVPEKRLSINLELSDSVSYSFLIKFKVIEEKSERRRANMANTIIKNGVDINAKNGDGETALLLSIKWHYPLVFKQLLAHGADINLSDKWNNSPAHWLFSLPNERVFPPEHWRSYYVEDFVQRWFSSLFYKKDLDLSIRNNEGKTALELAVQNGYRRMALLIIKKGTGYLSQNERERILRQAVEQSWPGVVKRLSNRNNLSTSTPSPSFFKNCRRVFSGFSPK